MEKGSKEICKQWRQGRWEDGNAINCDIPGLSASVVRNVGVGEMGRFNWGFDKLGGVVTL